jgi:hypothetical protein
VFDYYLLGKMPDPPRAGKENGNGAPD